IIERSAPVPEPGTIALFGGGLLMLPGRPGGGEPRPLTQVTILPMLQ
ncbi:MAG: PEP-CTERM sorting domain-containing protein, partial [Deltaproteobacteria bacterium]|nr:PEP-CTERM sorting domain-containing protein [Deltaproteobacteria bacterium]